MEDSATVTPDEYIELLDQLLSQGKDQEALDFAARVQPTVRPPLSPRQFDRVSGGLEGAAMAVAMQKAIVARRLPPAARTA